METSAKVWMGVAILLFFVIIGMTWVLITVPAVTVAPTVSTSTPVQPVEQEPVTKTPAADAPLSSRVIVSSPKANTTVGSRFEVKGEAPGNWFFEASFPVQVRDSEGNVIARTHASALGEWMTTEQVQFTSTINIETAYKGPATLILMRDNPSGLPEHDDAVEIPIVLQ